MGLRCMQQLLLCLPYNSEWPSPVCCRLLCRRLSVSVCSRFRGGGQAFRRSSLAPCRPFTVCPPFDPRDSLPPSISGLPRAASDRSPLRVVRPLPHALQPFASRPSASWAPCAVCPRPRPSSRRLSPASVGLARLFRSQNLTEAIFSR